MRFASARMGFIIARTAAKPAKFTPWISMSIEQQKMILKITGDPRLRVGVLAAIDHVCERRGLNGEEKRELGRSIEKECEKILEHQREPSLVVSVEELEDRMQVTVTSGNRVQATLVKHFHRRPAHS